MKSGIYKITNPEGKIYIGKSINCNKRFDDYRALDCKNQPEIFYSLKKYGWFYHIFEIIEKCEVDLLFTKEHYWINYYNSINEGLNSDGKNRGKAGRTLSQSAKDEKSTKMKMNWKEGNFKRNWGKPIKDNETGKVYNSRKECIEALNITSSSFYKKVGEANRFTYIKPY
jgi:group I intron endonuclease